MNNNVTVRKIETRPVTVGIEGITLLSVEEFRDTFIPIKPLDGNKPWWLYSPDKGSSGIVKYVTPRGTVSSFGTVVTDCGVYVRPALYIRTEEMGIGDEFVFGGVRWTIICKRLALCESALKKMPFLNDTNRFERHNLANYEVSDIKEFLDDWFAKAMGVCY